MSLNTGFGNYFCGKILGALLGAAAWTPPATWYGALLTVDGTDDDGTTLVEVPFTFSYARLAITNSGSSFNAPSTISHVETVTTAILLDWGTASGGAWGTIVAIAFFDASTAGNLGPWGLLSVSRTVNDGDPFQVTAGNGIFTLS